MREFWVVDPGDRYVRVYRLEPVARPRRFGEPVTVAESGSVDSVVLPGLAVPVTELFAVLR